MPNVTVMVTDVACVFLIAVLLGVRLDSCSLPFDLVDRANQRKRPSVYEWQHRNSIQFSLRRHQYNCSFAVYRVIASLPNQIQTHSDATHISPPTPPKNNKKKQLVQTAGFMRFLISQPRILSLNMNNSCTTIQDPRSL